jgi:hypothetical protein
LGSRIVPGTPSSLEGKLAASVRLWIFRLLFALILFMGEMKRANTYEEERRLKDRFASTLAISASIIAAVRLAPDDISPPSLKLMSLITDCVGLARMILDKVLR